MTDELAKRPHCDTHTDLHFTARSRGAVHPDLCRALALAGAILTVLVLVARS